MLDEQIAKLVEFARGDGRLRTWRDTEYRRLAASFDPLADIPLRAWQQQWVPSRDASWDAFSRLLGFMNRIRDLHFGATGAKMAL